MFPGRDFFFRGFSLVQVKEMEQITAIFARSLHPTPPSVPFSRIGGSSFPASFLPRSVPSVDESVQGVFYEHRAVLVISSSTPPFYTLSSDSQSSSARDPQA